jgi:hypothetical protein
MENIRIEVSQEESISERIKRARENLRGYTEEKYPVGDMIIDLGYMIDYIKYSFREFDRIEAENQRLKEQLKDYENVLKDYADGDFYEADINLLTNPLTNKEEVFSVDIQDKKGNVIYTKAQETLTKWEDK